MTNRKYLLKMPADWVPQEPAFEGVFEDGLSMVVSLIGVQGGEVAQRSAFIQQCNSALKTSGIVGANDFSIESARCRDKAGVENDVLIVYWRNAEGEQEFWRSSNFGAWWNDGKRLNEGLGYWRERFFVPKDRFETLISSDGYNAGATRLSKRISGPIQHHGYPGGSRDRIAASANDDFSIGVKNLTEKINKKDTKGKRLTYSAPRDLCVIRSGQDWTNCSDAEKVFYHGELAPTLKKGMDFLRDEGRSIGCYACRLMRETDEAGEDIARTFGLAYFGDLAQLESWAENHPTHLAILDKFLAFLKESNFNPGLVLWHEIFILPQGDHRCEYVNCHNETGFLPYLMDEYFRI